MTESGEVKGRGSQVHDHALMDLLPEMGPEDLDEGNLEGWNLPVHEDAGQVQLHLEAHIHVRAIDGGAPPECEAAVGDLIQAGALSVGQLLVLHGLFKPTRLQERSFGELSLHLCTVTRPCASWPVKVEKLQHSARGS